MNRTQRPILCFLVVALLAALAANPARARDHRQVYKTRTVYRGYNGYASGPYMVPAGAPVVGAATEFAPLWYSSTILPESAWLGWSYGTSSRGTESYFREVARQEFARQESARQESAETVKAKPHLVSNQSTGSPDVKPAPPASGSCSELKTRLDALDTKLQDLQSKVDDISKKVDAVFADYQKKQQAAMVEDITQEAATRAAKAVTTVLQNEQTKQNQLLANVLEELNKDKPDKSKIADAVKSLRSK